MIEGQCNSYLYCIEILAVPMHNPGKPPPVEVPLEFARGAGDGIAMSTAIRSPPYPEAARSIDLATFGVLCPRR